MRNLVGALIAGALVVGLPMAGCGGSNGSGADSTTSGSTETGSEITAEGKPFAKATFIQQANAICAANVKTIEAKAAKAFRVSENVPGYKQRLEEIDITATILAPELRVEQHELEDLGAPSGEEEQVIAIIKADDRALDKVELNPERTIREKRPFAEAEALTDKYGLTECPYG